MRHPSIKALYAYWNGLRDERPAPARTEINPRGIARELGDVFLLDGSPAEFHFRLAGSRIVAALGRPMTGAGFSEIWFEDARRNANSAVLSAAKECDPVLIGIRAFGPTPATTPLDQALHRHRPLWANFRDPDAPRVAERRGTYLGAGEMILLPLLHQGRVGTRLLGAMALFDPPKMPAGSPVPLDISGTRILGRSARPGSGTGLTPGQDAETRISWHGHLALIQSAGQAREPSNPEI